MYHVLKYFIYIYKIFSIDYFTVVLFPKNISSLPLLLKFSSHIQLPCINKGKEEWQLCCQVHLLNFLKMQLRSSSSVNYHM